MTDDPFSSGADTASDPWSETSNPAAEVQPRAVSTDVKHPFSIKLTLKANESYNAEWINPWVSGATADEAAANTVALLNALHKYGVIDKTAKAAEYTRGKYEGKSSQPAKPRQNNGGGGGGGQNNATPPPGVKQEHCDHGPMVFRSGTSKKGNPYKVWSCTSPDQNDQCRGIFVN